MASEYLDEEWARVTNWPMEISSHGRIYSISAHKFLKPARLHGAIGEDWYVLCGGSWHSVRRLVSRCFGIELPKEWEPYFDKTPRYRAAPYRGRVVHTETGTVFPNAKAAAGREPLGDFNNVTSTFVRKGEGAVPTSTAYHKGEF